MKRFLTLLGLILTIFFFINKVMGQVPLCPASNDTPPGCAICTFPYTGSSVGNSPGPLTSGNYGCGWIQVDNDQYFQFLARDPCVTFTIDAWNCSNASGWYGLQAWIFDLGLTTTYDCTQGCNTSGNSNPPPFQVTTCGLTPGSAYFLVVDGCAGSGCDFTVTAQGTQGGQYVTIFPNPPGPFCDNDPIFQLIGKPTGGTWTGDVSSAGEIDPGLLGAGSYSATYTFTNIFGCPDDETVTWDVIATPVVTLDPAGPFCVDDPSVSLVYTPPGGVWTGNGVTNGVFDPAVAGPGTHSITYEVDDNGCIGSETIDIIVFDLPVVTIDPIPDMCEDDPVFQVIGNPPGGVWSGDVNASGQIDPAALGAGTFSVTYEYTDANGCSNDDMLNFTINPLPTVTIDPAGPYCDNDSPVTLSASPSGGTWGGAVGSGGVFDPSVLGAGTHTVTYSYSDANGCSDDDQIDIIVNAAPMVMIPPAGPFCETDAAVTLSATPPGGVWTGTISSGGVFDPSAAGPGSHSVTYSYTDANGCRDQETITIVVTAAPVVTIDPAGPLCTNDAAITLSANPSGGTWGGAGAPSGVIDPATLGPGTYNVTYSYTGPGGCSDTDDIDITINPAPTVMVTPAGPFCDNDPPVTLSASPSGGVWSGASSTGTFDPSSAGPGTHTVIYTYTDANGCMDDDQVDIVVNAAPTPMITDPGPMCITAPSFTLTATPSGGTWGGVASSTGVVDPATLGAGSFTVTYAYTDANGCSANTDITITINPLPIVTISPAGPFCDNDPFQTLSASPIGGTWSGDVDGSGSFDPATLGPGTFTATYNYTDGNGCADSEVISFVINPAPVVMIPPAGPFCETDAPVTLTATPAGGTWGGAANSGGQFNPGMGPGLHTVTYSFTDANGCQDDSFIDIMVNPTPILDIFGPAIICISDPITTYVGTPVGGVWGGVANSNGQINPATLGVGTFTITYSYTDQNGCTGDEDFIFQIVDLPVVNINPAPPVCENDPIQVLTASPNGGLWTGDVSGAGTYDPALLGPGTYTANYEYSDVNGCFNTASINFVINPAPMVVIDPAGPYCEDQPAVTLTAMPAGGTWGGNISNNGVFDPSIAGVGTHVIDYTFTDANGCSDTEQIIIEVVELPDIYFFSPTDYCESEPPLILDVDPLGGVWGGAANANGEIDPSQLGPGVHTATYTYTDAAGCSDSDVFTFTVHAAPVLSISNLGPFCENDPPQVLVASPTGGFFSGAADFFGQVNPSVLGAGTHSVTYEYTDANNCTNSIIDDVIIVPAPNIYIDPPPVLCPGATTYTMNATPAGGTWGGVANFLGEVDPVALGPGVFDVSYTYQNSNGCTKTEYVPVIINDNIDILFITQGPFCYSNEIITLDVDPFGGNWSGDVNFLGEFNPINLGVGTFTAIYTYVDFDGCTSIDSLIFDIIQPGDVIFSGDSIFCETDPPYILQADPTGGTWTGSVVASNGEIDPSNTTPGVYTINYSVDLAGCILQEDWEIEIVAAPSVNINGPDSICVSNSSTTYVGAPSGGVWSGVANSTGEVDPSALGVGVHQVTYTVDYGPDCTTNNSFSFEVIDLPSATISGTGTLCPGGNSSTDLTISLTGSGPWVVTVERNGTAQAPITINASPYTLNVQQAGTYTILSVTDANGCMDSGSGTATVTTITPLSVSNLMTDCNPTATGYILTFEISGGDSSTYVVTGVNGSLSSTSPFIFTSDLIPTGSGFSFTVSDGSGCAPVSESLAIVDCACETEVGEMSMDTLSNCGPGTLTAVYDDTNEYLDPNDVLQFILHTNSGVSIGTVISTSSTPDVSFDPSTMQYGVIYFLSAVAGDNDGSGNVDLSDPCLQVAAGTPVIFYEIPTATLSGDTTICLGNPTDISISFTGTGPWSAVYISGTDTVYLNGISSSPYLFSITPTSTQTFQLFSVENEFCVGQAVGTATVNVNDSPQVTDLEVICDGTYTSYTVSFDITNGDVSTYYVNGNPGTLTGNSFVSDPIASGLGYSFEVGDANGCPPVLLVDTLVDCGCLTTVGALDAALIKVCEGEDAVAIYDDLLEELDADDIVQFVLHDGDANNLGNILIRNNTPVFSFDPSTMLFGVTYYITAIAGSDDGNGNVLLSDPCLDISQGTPVVFEAFPTATMSGDTLVCPNEEISITIELTGEGPWALIYNDGSTDRNITASASPFLITTMVSQTTTFNLVSVRDANCDGVISGDATISIISSPEVQNILIECNSDKTAYTVSFEIVGGDPTSYQVIGGAGTLVGNVFTSDFITSGDGYSFTVFDANRCLEVDVEALSVECECETEVGTIQSDVLNACIGDLVSVIHNGDEFLDFNDTLMFVLHDGTTDSLGTALIINSSPEFAFDPSLMTADTRYYISAVAGNIGVPLGINLADPCLSVSNGLPVLFYGLPTASIESDTTICNGTTVTLPITFTGTPPYTLTFADGTVLNNLLGDYDLVVTPSSTTSYTLTNIEDTNCANVSNSSVTVTVNDPPFATVATSAIVCNTDQSGLATNIDFSTLVTDGDLNGNWENVDNVTTTGSFPDLDFTGVPPGNYVFRYTTSSAVLPCVEAIYDVTVVVSDCSCPSVAIGQTGPYCADDAVVDLSTIEITTEPGIWSIQNAPNGSTATVVGDQFNATGSVAGDYVLQFTLALAPPTGCPDNSTTTITIVAPPFATVTPNAVVCNTDQNNDPTTFDFSTLITGGDNGGSWTNTDNAVVSGTFPVLDFMGTTPGTYIFTYSTNSAIAPCGEVTYDVAVVVSDCSCPSVDLGTAGPFCNDAAALDLGSLQITTESGTWAILSTPSGSTATLNGDQFDGTGSAAGTYVFEFTLDQTPPVGCPISNTVSIDISQNLTAGTSSGNLVLCNNGPSSINLFDELVGESLGGTWEEISILESNQFATNSGVLDLNGIAAGTYEFKYTVIPDAPCLPDSAVIRVVIENPVYAGQVVDNPSFCEDVDTILILTDYLTGQDAGGLWVEVSTNPSSSFDANNATFSTIGQNSGEYRFAYQLEGIAPCTNDESIITVTINALPIADAGEDKTKTCNGNEIVIGGTNTSQGAAYDYQWIGGTVVSPTSSSTSVSNPGIYTLIVTNSVTGCSASDVVEVSQEGNFPILQGNSISITCYGDDDGSIIVENVIGGVPPYLYSLNGGPFSSTNVFTNLGPGDYEVAVEDANGCQDRVTFSIFEPDELTVSLSVNLENNVLILGDSALLTAQVSTNAMDSVWWSPANAFLPCDPEDNPDCLSQWVAPDVVTTYSVTVRDTSGCLDSDQLTLNVKTLRKIYIPSAFSPEDDGINDKFRIFSDENIEKIQSFLIFDRWGTQLFEATNFQPDDPKGQWDGTYRGKKLDPAVFVYFAIVEFRDGTTELYKGDVTLVK